MPHPLRVCFVTGTRAEFGLMRSVLAAIGERPLLQLQIIATGIHLDPSRGNTLEAIRQAGWTIDAVIPWDRGDGSQPAAAIATGNAIASMTTEFETLKTDIVLVTGDRVEAFAGASAGHLCGKIVAHVHGGDRALGLVDDSLRHAITKLSHVHFPATRQSAERIARMGEDRWRIFRVGSPGLDDIRDQAAPWHEIAAIFPSLRRRTFALFLLHPQTPDPSRERAGAELLLRAVDSIPFSNTVLIYPNNDPGSDGITSCWESQVPDERRIIRRDIPRRIFLGLLRETAVLVGNSSSGIIEAASFGTPVLDIGSRQDGRERGTNVSRAELSLRMIRAELRRIWNNGSPIRYPRRNIYGAGGAGTRIAAALEKIDLPRFRRKLIAY